MIIGGIVVICIVICEKTRSSLLALDSDGRLYNSLNLMSRLLCILYFSLLFIAVPCGIALKLEMPTSTASINQMLPWLIGLHVVLTAIVWFAVWYRLYRKWTVGVRIATSPARMILRLQFTFFAVVTAVFIGLWASCVSWLSETLLLIELYSAFQFIVYCFWMRAVGSMTETGDVCEVRKWLIASLLGIAILIVPSMCLVWPVILLVLSIVVWRYLVLFSIRVYSRTCDT